MTIHKSSFTTVDSQHPPMVRAICANPLLDTLQEGIIIITPDGLVAAVNKVAQLLYRDERELTPGTLFADYAPQDWVEVKRVLTSGQPQLNKLLMLPSGEVLINRVPLMQDHRVYGVVSTMQDVDTYDTVVQRLSGYRRLNDEFEAVIEQDDAMIMVDASGLIIRVNTSFECLVGLGRQAMVGRNVMSLRRDPVRMLPTINECLQQQTLIGARFTHQDGTPFLLRTAPTFDAHGELAFVVCRIHNLTQFAVPEEHGPSILSDIQPDETTDFTEENKKIRKMCAEAGFVVRSPLMCQVVRLALKVSQADSSVLVRGESGVGKSMLATLIHNHSTRKDKPFVSINCGAIPEALMESELFGYEKGAFTGAAPQGKAGLLEAANTGTIFFDEVGELKYPLQVKLLEVMDKKSFMRVGSTRRLSVDIRIIAATNRNLERDVQENTFRKDLYYRLNVIPLIIPPLREHPEDIVAMAQEILTRSNVRYSRQKHLSKPVMQWLMRYPFPGNVRELVNVMEWMLVMSEADEIIMSDLPVSLQACELSLPLETEQSASETFFAPKRNAAAAPIAIPEPPEGFLPLKDAMRHMEEQYLRRVIAVHERLQDAAAALDVHTSTLWRKMSIYGIKTDKV